VIVPLLEGTDGVQKMSKSLGNYIGITEPPAEIFGKVMSISDDLMWRYYELLTDLTSDQITSLQRAAENGERNPRDMKVELAKLIIADFHSTEDATRAEEEFNRIFRSKDLPDEIPERVLRSGPWNLPHLLLELGMASSVAEARRLIQQGGVGVWVDGERQDIPNSVTIWKSGMTTTIRVGKRRFARARFA